MMPVYFISVRWQHFIFESCYGSFRDQQHALQCTEIMGLYDFQLYSNLIIQYMTKKKQDRLTR